MKQRINREAVEANRLLSEAIESVRRLHPPGTYLPEQPDDFGRLLLHVFAVAAKREAAGLRAGLREELADGARTARVGPQRRCRHSRPIMALTGEAGTQIPAGMSAQSADGERKVGLPACKLRLGRINRIVGLDSENEPVAIPDADSPTPDRALRGLRLDLDWGSGTANGAPTGVLWNVPSAIGSRLAAASGCRAIHLPDGSVFLLPTMDGARLPARIELVVALDPSEFRHALRFTANAVVARDTKPPQTDDLLPPIEMLTHSVGDDVGIVDTGTGWPARRAESLEAWRRKADAAARHGFRAVIAADYRDLVQTWFPDLRVLSVEPCRVGPARQRCDGVRVVLLPRRWESAFELMNRVMAVAGRVQRFLQSRAEEGIRVVAGPPGLAWTDPPPFDDPLSLYRGFLACGRAELNRPEHPDWPVFKLDDPRLLPEGSP